MTVHSQMAPARQPRVLSDQSLDKVAGGDAHKETIEIASWSLGATNPSSANMVSTRHRP